MHGTLSDVSTLEVTPYAPAPHVMFFQATLVPETTEISGGSPGIEASLDRMVIWGLLVTNGVTFEGAGVFPSNHQYELSATVN